MIGIVDYNAGNIKSVERALSFLNCEYVISKNPIELKNADKLIFPGVGEAKYAMEQLNKTGFDIFLKDFADSQKPLLGICLGSQIIFDYSEEGDVNCLGLIKGKIKHFDNVLEKNCLNENGLKYKIPHMGWNNLEHVNGECKILKDVPETSDFYFVHSYVICPEDNSVIKAVADYGIKVPSVVQFNNIYACQFHPEKSGKYGLKILENFCNA